MTSLSKAWRFLFSFEESTEKTAAFRQADLCEKKQDTSPSDGDSGVTAHVWHEKRAYAADETENAEDKNE